MSKPTSPTYRTTNWRSVTAPLLPRRFSFDAGREIGVLHEVIKELMPGWVYPNKGT
jgi:hypothetical protein